MRTRAHARTRCEVDGFAPGTFSSGQLSPSNTGAWSLMPNSFVVVKDVTVKAALSSAEKAERRFLFSEHADCERPGAHTDRRAPF